MLENNLVHCGDVIDLLSQTGDLKFKSIIADPPYNISKDFGNSRDSMPLTEYVVWSISWIQLCLDRLDTEGLLFVYGFPEILAHISVNFDLNNQRILVWHYTNKTSPNSKFWQRSYESILVLWNGSRPSLNIDLIREPYTDAYLGCAGKVRKETKGRFGDKETTYNVNDKGALPRDVLKVSALAGGAGKKERYFLCKDCNSVFPLSELAQHSEHETVIHPTQKPLNLTKKLILSTLDGLNPGNILIPFAGSGAECLAAKQLGQNYLGFDLNPDYVQLSNLTLELDV